MAEQDINQLTIRRAAHSDCASIKAIIRGLYNGNDKFLYIFHKHIILETSFPYVAEISGEIVGYTCGQVKEDGEIMIMREGRVCQKYQGKAVIAKLNTVLIQAALAKFPNLQKLMWCSGSKFASEKAIKKNLQIKLVYHGAAEKCKINTCTLKPLSESHLFRQLEEKYSIDAITAVPKREALRLLTEEICFLDYAPTRPIIGWQPSGWRRSTLAPDLQVTDLFITRSSPGSRIQAFSFFTVMGNDVGARIEVISHCAEGEHSADLIIAHILHGLREIVALYTDVSHVICGFHFPAHVDKEAVLQVLNGKLGIASNVNEDITVNMLEYNLRDAPGKKSML